MKKSNQENYIETFDEVHVPEALMGKVIEMGKQEKESQKWRRGKVVAAAAGVLCVVSVTTVSAANIWNNYTHDRYGIEDSKVQNWKEEKLLQENNLFVEKHGVKVACKEVIASGPFAHVLLEVTLDDAVQMGDDPSFGSVGCVASDGEIELLCAGVPTSLYEPELMVDKENKVFYLEYQLKLQQEEGEKSKTSWDGQTVMVSLVDFGNCKNSKVEVEPTVSGKWELEIPMVSCDKTVTVKPDQDFGNGLQLKEFTLSPISIDTEFRSEKKVNNDEADLLAPIITAYETKGGEKVEIEAGMGSSNCNGKNIKNSFILERVVDIDNVTAVYFGNVKVELK